jgi:hypothetical protein
LLSVLRQFEKNTVAINLEENGCFRNRRAQPKNSYYYDGSNVAMWTVADSSAGTTFRHIYFNGVGPRATMADTSYDPSTRVVQAYWHVTDRDGSVRQVINNDGTYYLSMDFSPWGAATLVRTKVRWKCGAVPKPAARAKLSSGHGVSKSSCMVRSKCAVIIASFKVLPICVGNLVAACCEKPSVPGRARAAARKTPRHQGDRPDTNKKLSPLVTPGDRYSLSPSRKGRCGTVTKVLLRSALQRDR